MFIEFIDRVFLKGYFLLELLKLLDVVFDEVLIFWDSDEKILILIVYFFFRWFIFCLRVTSINFSLLRDFFTFFVFSMLGRVPLRLILQWPFIGVGLSTCRLVTEMDFDMGSGLVNGVFLDVGAFWHDGVVSMCEVVLHISY